MPRITKDTTDKTAATGKVKTTGKAAKVKPKEPTKHPCPCCGQLTIEEPGEFEVCPVCGWEDDKSQSKDPDLKGGANTRSLNEARAAFEKKNKQVLHDKDIREPLCFFLEETFGKSRIFEEKRMGNSRADMVMVLPGALCGIEIKSDADTYVRLARQVKDYSRYYDYNYVVVGGSHGNHIEEHVPEDWGIITVDNDGGRPDFYILRKATANPKMDPALKISILWRPELNHILELNRLKEYKSKSKAFIQKYILESVESEILAHQLSEELFERDYDTIKERIDAYRESKGLHKRRNTKKRKRKYKEGI